MATLKQLSRNLIRRMNTIEKMANKAAMVTTEAVLEFVAKDTPADTSQAISNWQIGIGAPNAPIIRPHVPGLAGQTAAQSTRISVTVGKALISKKPPGITLFVSNSLDYIRDLDLGKSPQSRNFVKNSVAVGVRRLRTFLRSKSG